MKRFLLLLFFPLFSGTITPAFVQVPCISCDSEIKDTTIPDSIKDSIRMWIKEPVDSFKAVKSRELDSLKGVYDSLSTEVKNVERESKKKLVYQTDTIKGLLMCDGIPVIKDGRTIPVVNVWISYYWRFSDGERRYSHYTIKYIQ